mmetsp:Transcript_20528/g.54744  ORF Transcript_20528/g.54744 Transcript_20528/m.54744 type:complete len:310 (-) Transcript_20528:3824-4753(-)
MAKKPRTTTTTTTPGTPPVQVLPPRAATKTTMMTTTIPKPWLVANSAGTREGRPRLRLRPRTTPQAWTRMRRSRRRPGGILPRWRCRWSRSSLGSGTSPLRTPRFARWTFPRRCSCTLTRRRLPPPASAAGRLISRPRQIRRRSTRRPRGYTCRPSRARSLEGSTVARSTRTISSRRSPRRCTISTSSIATCRSLRRTVARASSRRSSSTPRASPTGPRCGSSSNTTASGPPSSAARRAWNAVSLATSRPRPASTAKSLMPSRTKSLRPSPRRSSRTSKTTSCSRSSLRGRPRKCSSPRRVVGLGRRSA